MDMPRDKGSPVFGPAEGALLLLVFAALRALLALAAPSWGGDSELYRDVARNILDNGCVSLMDPVAASCVPHWGGNQLPGYPAFIAAVWALFGVSDTPVLLVQAVLAAGSAVWCGLCAGRLTDSRRAAYAVALVLGLSPLGIPWARFLLTEALSITAIQMVIAELLLMLHSGRARPMLGVAFTAAVFVRYDNALLLAPILVVAAAMPDRVRVARSLVTVAVVVALPLAAWWTRSVAQGLAPVPDVSTMPDGSPPPDGYMRWSRMWIIDQYEYPLWSYPVYGQKYSALRIPDRAFRTQEEARTVAALVARLQAYEGRPIPPDIDAAFDALADERMRNDPLREIVVLPAIRAAIMWSDPRYSSGWPVSLEQFSGTAAELARSHPFAVLTKVGTGAYRVLLLAAAALLWLPRARRAPPARVMLLAALTTVLAQTAFHVALGLLETRYLLSATTLLEASIALALFWPRTDRTR